MLPHTLVLKMQHTDNWQGPEPRALCPFGFFVLQEGKKEEAEKGKGGRDGERKKTKEEGKND